MKRSVSPLDVRTELWGSFVSLLKSYAAVASLHGAPHDVLVLSDTSLDIVAAPDTLKISYHPTLGRGVWSLFRGTDRFQDAEQPEEINRGNFDLELDGTITLDGISVDMDHAAIQLVAALTHAASTHAESQEEIEVPA